MKIKISGKDLVCPVCNETDTITFVSDTIREYFIQEMEVNGKDLVRYNGIGSIDFGMSIEETDVSVRANADGVGEYICNNCEKPVGINEALVESVKQLRFRQLADISEEE